MCPHEFREPGPLPASPADQPELERICALFKALGDPSRLRIVFTLQEGERCVGDLAQATGISESAVSQHLRRLRNLALVRSRRQAQTVFYSLDDDHVDQLLAVSLAHVRH